MEESEKIIVKFPASWGRADLEISAGAATPEGAFVDAGGSRFTMSYLNWMMSVMQTSRNVLLLNFDGTFSWHDLMQSFVKKGLKN